MSEQIINTSPEYLALVNIIYPVGHIYKSTKDVDPSTFIPGTSWVRMIDRFLYNSSTTIDNSSRDGGEVDVELIEVPVHNHLGDLYHRSHYSDGNVKDFNQAAPNSPGNSGSLPSMDTSYVGGSTIQSVYLGETKRHNNMPPYRAIYIWRRVL